MSCENHYVRFVSVLSSGAGDLAAKTCNVISSNYEKRQIPHLYLLNQRPKNSDHKDRLSEVFGNPVDCFEEALHQGRSYLFIDRQNARASEKEMLALKLPDHRFIYTPGHQDWLSEDDVTAACSIGDRVFIAVNIASQIEFMRVRILLEMLSPECLSKVRVFVWKNLLTSHRSRQEVCAPLHWILTPQQWFENIRTLKREVCC